MKCSIQNSVDIFIPGVFYIFCVLYFISFVFYLFRTYDNPYSAASFLNSGSEFTMVS